MTRTPTDYALFLLSQRDRSVGEIKEKMGKRFAPEEINETVKFLIDKKFLDDDKFAKHYVQNQINIKPQGKIRLIQKLKRYKIDDGKIESAISQIDESEEKELAETAAGKWIKKYGEISDFKKKERLMRHLLSRGFNYDTIISAINKLTSNN